MALLFIAIIAAKEGIGMSFCIKIEHKYFMVNEKYMNKTALSFWHVNFPEIALGLRK